MRTGKKLLGRKPYKPSHRDLRFKDYLKTELMPPIPAQYGHEDLITEQGNCLGNDEYPNCVEVAIWRMIMAWNKARGVTINVSADTVVKTWEVITGCNRNDDPSTWEGTDERDALTYALNTGFTDDDGNVHKIGGFANIDVSNQSHLDAAAYWFEAILLGIDVTDANMDQFNAGQPFDIAPNENVEGGHGVPDIAKRINRICMTWGEPEPYTLAFQQKRLMEAWCVWSPEMFANGKTLEGIDEQSLLADQKLVQS